MPILLFPVFGAILFLVAILSIVAVNRFLLDFSTVYVVFLTISYVFLPGVAAGGLVHTGPVPSDVNQECIFCDRSAAEASDFEGADSFDAQPGDADCVSDSKFDSVYVSDDQCSDPLNDNLAEEVNSTFLLSTSKECFESFWQM